jgi:hypothetical protein
MQWKLPVLNSSMSSSNRGDKQKYQPPMISSLLTHFRKKPLINTLLLIVIGLHSFFLLILFISPTFVIQKKQHKPLIVKTIVPKPLAKTVTLEKTGLPQNAAATPLPKSAQKSAPTPQQQPMPKAQTQPKKEQTAKTVALKPASSAKKEAAIADKQLGKTAQPVPKKNPPAQNRAKISDSLWKELEESIAKIESKSDKGMDKKTARSTKSLTPIALQIDTAWNEAEGVGDYKVILADYLHQVLSLPDYGEVKIQLSLRQDGTVCKVVVLKAQSERNKQYLESNLPRLKFPHLDEADASKTEHTFVLTFCNE